ncbi:MAG: ABC transporter ATP-binding protein [Planctomycetes bacterium]|nr:ABC transporter ATP-binding protein [Planctomycetota bacterium]
MTVRLDNLTIKYGARVAVDAVTVEFPTGASGLLGRNGAGKSSILKAMLGLVRPAAGRIQVLDLPAGVAGTELRARVGYMPERDAHLPAATGFEMVAVLGRLSGMPRRHAWRRAHETLYMVGLDEQRYRPVSTYSAGMRQKAKLAAALVHDPDVLFLDEPTNGLDPAGRSEMLALVGRLAREHGKSIVLSTHILQDVEAVCEHVVVLEAGSVLASGGIAELTRARQRRFELAVEPAGLELPAELPVDQTIGATPSGESVPAVVRIEARGNGRFVAALPPGVTPRPVFEAVASRGGAVRRLASERRSLEDVFLQFVTRKGSE